MAKTSISKKIREDMYAYLAFISLDKEYKKLNAAIVKFSNFIYDLRFNANLKNELENLDIDADWLKHSNSLPISLKSKVYAYQGYRVSPIDIVNNTVDDWNKPISNTETDRITLYFSDYRPVPFNNVSKIFALSDAEIKEYFAIVNKHEKRINKIIDSVKTAMAIISSFKYFEDLFDHWEASQKLFDSIYQERKETQLIDKKKFLPSVDVDDLNKDLGLEE